EDGIRDFHVTGVQTCALPIYASSAVARDRLILALLVLRDLSSNPWSILTVLGMSCTRRTHSHFDVDMDPGGGDPRLPGRAEDGRSEERRVGKEGRCRWRREM